eukprot:tig00020964_g16772.t1
MGLLLAAVAALLAIALWRAPLALGPAGGPLPAQRLAALGGALAAAAAARAAPAPPARPAEPRRPQAVACAAIPTLYGAAFCVSWALAMPSCLLVAVAAGSLLSSSLVRLRCLQARPAPRPELDLARGAACEAAGSGAQVLAVNGVGVALGAALALALSGSEPVRAWEIAFSQPICLAAFVFGAAAARRDETESRERFMRSGEAPAEAESFREEYAPLFAELASFRFLSAEMELASPVASAIAVLADLLDALVAEASIVHAAGAAAALRHLLTYAKKAPSEDSATVEGAMEAAEASGESDVIVQSFQGWMNAMGAAPPRMQFRSMSYKRKPSVILHGPVPGLSRALLEPESDALGEALAPACLVSWESFDVFKLSDLHRQLEQAAGGRPLELLAMHLAEKHRVEAAKFRAFVSAVEAGYQKVRMEFRRLVIDMVLATDMAKHFKRVGEFKAKVLASSLGPIATGGGPQGSRVHHVAVEAAEPGSVCLPEGPFAPEDRTLFLAMALKVADISNAARPLPQHAEWCARVNEEFYRQGDEERRIGLPVSQFCDRTAGSPATTTAGFASFIAVPLFQAWASRFPVAHPLVERAQANLAHWRAMVSPHQPDPPASPPPFKIGESAGAGVGAGIAFSLSRSLGIDLECLGGPLAMGSAAEFEFARRRQSGSSGCGRDRLPLGSESDSDREPGPSIASRRASTSDAHRERRQPHAARPRSSSRPAHAGRPRPRSTSHGGSGLPFAIGHAPSPSPSSGSELELDEAAANAAAPAPISMAPRRPSRSRRSSIAEAVQEALARASSSGSLGAGAGYKPLLQRSGPSAAPAAGPGELTRSGQAAERLLSRSSSHCKL